MRLRAVAFVLGVLALSLVFAGSAMAAFAPGAPGLGDPLFPLAGNGGYDVSHYSLRLAYEPATQRLDGNAVIAATATQDLGRFDLDLRGFAVSDVRVDGGPALFTRDGQELQITPARPLRRRAAFVVTLPTRAFPRWSPTRTARSRAGSRR